MWKWWRWWRLCIGQWTTTLHMLKVAIHGHYPLLHGLYLLHLLLLVLLVLLIQLHVPPIHLLKLLLHWFIQCMHPIMDVLHIDPCRPSSRHINWRIWLVVGSPNTINPPIIVAANRLGPYLIITNRWASRSALVLLLGLLQSDLGQSLGELKLQLEEIKQIKLDLNSNKYKKLKALETKIMSTYVSGFGPSINPLGLVLLPGIGLPE